MSGRLVVGEVVGVSSAPTVGRAGYLTLVLNVSDIAEAQAEFPELEGVEAAITTRVPNELTIEDLDEDSNATPAETGATGDDGPMRSVTSDDGSDGREATTALTVEGEIHVI